MSFVVLLIAAFILGTWTLRPLSIGTDIEGLSYRLLVGLVLSAIPIMVVGSASLGAVQFGLYLVAGCGLAHELFAVKQGKWRPAGEGRATAPLDWVERISAATIALALVFALISTLAPATSWDACVAHLALPSNYVRVGHFEVFEGNPYSAYPHLMHCLFTAAFLRGGETGAMLLSWTFAVLGCAVAYSTGKRLVDCRAGGRRIGLIAAAILSTTPIFIDQAGTASLDLAFSVTVLASLNALLAWRQDKNLAWVGLAAVLAGSGCGIRHTGYVTCVLLAAIVLFTRDRRWLGANLTFLGVTFLAALPWLLRSAALVNNPFYPFFINVFSPGSLPDTDITAVASHESIRNVGMVGLLRFPWDIVMHPEWYDGWTKSPGPLALLLGVPGLLIGGKRCRMVGGFAIAGGALLFFFRQFARYLLPFFLPMMVVAAVAACRLRSLRAAMNVLLVIVFIYGLGLGFAAVHFKIPAALGLESREEYLTRRVERYPAFAWLNQSIHTGETILTLDPRSYFILGATYQNPPALLLLSRESPEKQLEWLKERNIGYVFYPKAYVEETPGFRESGTLTMLNAWRRDNAHFVPVKRLSMNRPGSDKKERVEIYEVRYDS